MLIINGIGRVAGAAAHNAPQYWRVDDLDKNRMGIDSLLKPTALFLVEDWTEPALQKLIGEINASREEAHR